MSAAGQKAQAIAAGGEPIPTSQSASIADATPTPVAHGVRSSGPADAAEARHVSYVPVSADGRNSNADALQNYNEDAEQLATLAEGKVAHAVERKSGGQKVEGETVTEQTFTDDLERKKAEQKEAREAIKEQRRAGLDVDGSLGQGRPGGDETLKDV